VDRISTYRQIRLLVGVGERYHTVSVLARSVHRGHQTDRLLVRCTVDNPLPADSIRGVLDVLEQALQRLDEQV
jgi:hypothetical protein